MRDWGLVSGCICCMRSSQTRDRHLQTETPLTLFHPSGPTTLLGIFNTSKQAKQSTHKGELLFQLQQTEHTHRGTHRGTHAHTHRTYRSSGLSVFLLRVRVLQRRSWPLPPIPVCVCVYVSAIDKAVILVARGDCLFLPHRQQHKAKTQATHTHTEVLTDILGLVLLPLGQGHEAGKDFLREAGVLAKERVGHFGVVAAW